MNEPSRPVSSHCTLRISISDMVSLKVRTKGLRDPAPPDLLYQVLPEKAMPLMATLPCGDFAVSIPGVSRGACGYPILKSAPFPAKGFVIVYKRGPNGRYEADQVRYAGAVYALADFIPIAKLWVHRNYGGLKPASGRYAYMTPSIDEWGVFLRDNGYTALDPSAMQADISPEILSGLTTQHSSGVLARIPVFTGENVFSGEPAPVFAQVEVGAGPGFPNVWSRFNEYKKERMRRSQLPDAILSVFGEWLSRLTEESGFDYWIVRPGMLFGDCVEWWSDGCRRLTEHEGVDFAEGFRTGEGMCRIADGVPARSVAEGEVVAVLDDFIAKTVVVRHRAITRVDDEVFHTFLSHIRPEPGLSQYAAKGQIVGRVGKSTNAAAPSHLHLTGVWLPENIPPEEIGLHWIHPGCSRASLANFNPVLRMSPLCRFV